MRKVFKFVGIVAAVVIILTLVMGTVAMAAGPNNPSGECPNTECPNIDCPNPDCVCDGEGQLQTQSHDCVCDGDQIMTHTRTKEQTCLQEPSGKLLQKQNMNQWRNFTDE